jgi:hypothetical protein
MSRTRFAQNLDGLRALATLTAVRDVTSKQLAIEGGGGGVRLIERLVRLSEAIQKLNATVTIVQPGTVRKNMDSRYSLNQAALTRRTRNMKSSTLWLLRRLSIQRNRPRISFCRI